MEVERQDASPGLLALCDACAFPREERPMVVLGPVEALGDIRAWLEDRRTYKPKLHRPGWISSIADLRRTFRTVGPTLAAEVRSPVGDLLRALGPLPGKAQTPLRRAALDEAVAMETALLAPKTVAAAWDDLVEGCWNAACTADELENRRQAFKSLVVRRGHNAKELGNSLRRVLRDSAIAVALAKVALGDMPAPNQGQWPDPQADANLPENERVKLCRRTLTAPPAKGDSVVWIAFEPADIHSNHLDFGLIQFWDGRWVREGWKEGGRWPPQGTATTKS